MILYQHWKEKNDAASEVTVRHRSVLYMLITTLVQ